MTTIAEFKSGLYDVIDPYFRDQSSKTINGKSYFFPRSVMYFDIRELEVYAPSAGNPPIPVLTMIPSLSKVKLTAKCPGSLVITTPVTCYIKMLAYSPLSLPDGTPANHKLLADYAWNLLQLVINTQVTKFNAVNIFKPTCDRYPQDVTDDKETVLIGTAYFETYHHSYFE